MSTATREERLARRVADLYATDEQFANARPSEAVTAATSNRVCGCSDRAHRRVVRPHVIEERLHLGGLPLPRVLVGELCQAAHQ